MSTTQQYTRVTVAQFEDFLGSIAAYEVPDDVDATEKVYDIPLPEDDLVIRIFSTMQDGAARDKGSDAIRCTVFDKESNSVIGGEKKTLRIQTWRNNLEPKIRDLVANWRDYSHGRCSCCNARMAKRDGKYGEFLGCTNYPACKNTTDL